MKKENRKIPEYGTTMRNGILYYRTRLTGADGKSFSLYARTPEELLEKEETAQAQIEEILFHQANPTVAEYCEKWLQMRSVQLQPQTVRDYERLLRNYVVKSLGEMYMSEVTPDDLRMAMVPLSRLSAQTYATGNMLIKCIFYSAERSRLIEYNPSENICPRGGAKSAPKEALTDEQVKILLNTICGLPPYPVVMLGLYAGLRREEILALQWDCVFLDAPTPYISVRRAWRCFRN